ncbi:MAG: isocitrate lyase/PEP mutase family protein [Bryobacteraceae bacterium]
MTQSEKTQSFAAMHNRERILVLPNAWDVASARIFEEAGFPAIATSSAGVAAALGYPDGQHISREMMIEVVHRVAAAVAVPVTADVEAGYGDPLRTALAVMNAGAVGMNLEDTVDETPAALTPVAEQAKAIRSIRSQTNLVINARTDIFLAEIGDPGTRFNAAVERLNAYWDAGANCLFAPGVSDSETIGKLVRAVPGPLNILAVAGTPAVSELQRLGVARVTIGSGAMRAALGLTRRIAQELMARGTYSLITEGAIGYAEVNRLLAPIQRRDRIHSFFSTDNTSAAK